MKLKIVIKINYHILRIGTSIIIRMGNVTEASSRWFEWVEDTSQFNEDFIKICNENSDITYFNKADVQYPEKLHKLQNNLPFFPEKMKTEKI